MFSFRLPSLTVTIFILILAFSSILSTSTPQSFRYENSDLSSISPITSTSLSARYANKGELIIEFKSEAGPNIKLEEPKAEPNEIQKAVKASREDFVKLAYTVEQEAHDLSFEHKKLIVQVILNRVHHKKFPNSISKVLAQKNQFQGYINYKTKKFKPTQETILACQSVIKNNNYNNVLFFYNRSKAKPHCRKFFEHNEKLTHVKTIEGHRFFAMK